MQTDKKRKEIANRPQKVKELLSDESKFKQYIVAGKAHLYSFQQFIEGIMHFPVYIR